MPAIAENPHRSVLLRQAAWVESGLWVSGLLLMAALLGWGLAEFSQARDVRCYPLNAVRSMSAQLTLKGQSLLCMSNRCRVVMRYLPQQGLACYFSAYRLSARPFTVAEVTPSASQKSFAPPAYRTR